MNINNNIKYNSVAIDYLRKMVTRDIEIVDFWREYSYLVYR